MQNKLKPIQKKIGLLQTVWPVAASVGIILTDNGCGEYQPPVGSTIPSATDPELYKEVSWAWAWANQQEASPSGICFRFLLELLSWLPSITDFNIFLL